MNASQRVAKMIWLSTISIMAIGLVTLYSASYNNLRVEHSVFYDQLLFALAGLVLIFFISRGQNLICAPGGRVEQYPLARFHVLQLDKSHLRPFFLEGVQHLNGDKIMLFGRDGERGIQPGRLEIRDQKNRGAAAHDEIQEIKRRPNGRFPAGRLIKKEITDDPKDMPGSLSRRDVELNAVCK